MSHAAKTIVNLYPRLDVLIFRHSMGWTVPPILVTVHCIDGTVERHQVHPVR